ncbi:MAG: C-terminal binding protein [Caldilineaceae bacterium SB0670_bin_27]|uniref:C-terminal binding protein n=1 Tax=Caldilineaceae bacterium SB0664_bin_27 TaxID=2605260 RepID=A0A6B0Z2W3_9CHLR|nr:C-terminal binding protein [Caldilineaceae bacterium SB0664_bin_27]MYJ76692.1 C-terminal binding protein [Caldilineaceae bacterium SB0670_bin_27]
MTSRILITDIAWPDYEIEKEVLSAVEGEIMLAGGGTPAEIIALAPRADAILTCWKDVPPEALDIAPDCKVVSRYGIGLDNIPIGRATELGMLVTNVPDFCLEEVSDHVMALLLATARQLLPLARNPDRSGWTRETPRPIPRVRGQTLGLIGFGNIARALVPKALGFGLRVIAYTPRLRQSDAPEGVEVTNDLAALLSTSDYVSIHCPLTEETAHIIDESALAQMKSSALLINTSRGGVIDEEALIRALQDGRIGGAALDVTDPEPPSADNPLLALENVIVTPHAAFYSVAATAELARKAAANVVTVLQGGVPETLVNEGVLERDNCRLSL